MCGGLCEGFDTISVKILPVCAIIEISNLMDVEMGRRMMSHVSDFLRDCNAASSLLILPTSRVSVGNAFNHKPQYIIAGLHTIQVRITSWSLDNSSIVSGPFVYCQNPSAVLLMNAGLTSAPPQGPGRYRPLPLRNTLQHLGHPGLSLRERHCFQQQQKQQKQGFRRRNINPVDTLNS